MPAVPLRVLIVNNQVKFSTALKKTLEQLGGFEVAPCSTFETAMVYAKNRAFDVAMIDTRTKDASAYDFIQRLRVQQPHVAVLLSPMSEENSATVNRLELQGVVELPISARKLIPLLHRARSDAMDMLPDTVIAPRMADLSSEAPPTTAPLKSEFSSLEAVIDSEGAVEDASATLEVDMVEVEALMRAERQRVLNQAQAEPSVVDRIIAEEPPPPTVEQGGTVRDAVADVEMDTGQRVIEILKTTQTQEIVAPVPLDFADGDYPDADVPNLARELLMKTADLDAPLEVLSAAADAAESDVELIDDSHEREERLAQSSLMRALDPDAPKPAPELAQLALQLTQASLELTAEGMLLSDGEEVVAAAGDLPADDIEGLRELIGGDWSAPTTQSRIRFFTLPSSGKDYMLYSRRTVGGLTLTMIFAGKTPISDIRRQSNRVMEALISVPDDSSAPANITPQTVSEYQGVRLPQTYIWVLSDSQVPFDAPLVKVLEAGLRVSLTREAWLIHTLDVYEYYIYLYADVPGDRPPFEVVAQLKQISAQIVRMRDPNIVTERLWGDSYMVVVPGRELNGEEIERFVNFATG